jgi:hypothetical protein
VLRGRRIPTCCSKRSAATYAGTVSATVRARSALSPSGVLYVRLNVPSPCFWMLVSFHCTLQWSLGSSLSVVWARHADSTLLTHTDKKALHSVVKLQHSSYWQVLRGQTWHAGWCSVTEHSPHLMLSAYLAAMARGSDCRPFRKEPTVWPAGFGGSRASRGGGGVARFA